MQSFNNQVLKKQSVFFCLLLVFLLPNIVYSNNVFITKGLMPLAFGILVIAIVNKIIYYKDGNGNYF